jgi:hypothetical protein
MLSGMFSLQAQRANLNSSNAGEYTSETVQASISKHNFCHEQQSGGGANDALRIEENPEIVSSVYS